MKPLKNILIILTLLAIMTPAQAQNLVPNPSFEEHSNCPWYYAQTYFATGWTINVNSADYFHSCGEPDFSVPDNLFGYQFPPDTNCNAYAGFYAIPFNQEYREYIGAKLNTPLIIGEQYYISFKVVLSNEVNCGVDGLGAFFTNVDYGDTLINPPTPIPFSAHIYTSQVITDTANWIRVSGSFIADSAYQNILIGHCFDIDSTIFECLNEYDYPQSYYFIDDICVSTDSTYCWDYNFTCDPNSSKEILNDKFSIYPNPAINYFYIEINEFKSTEIPRFELYNAFGKLILNRRLKNTKTKLNIENLRKGLYFIKIHYNKKNTIEKLLIK